MMNFSSKLIEDGVNALSSLPGIGKKTALRLVLHLLKEPTETVEQFGNTLIRMRRDIRFCKQCHNISDADLCSLCNNPRRDSTLLCVVENVRDVMAIEQTAQFNGLYHVLGGLIAPLDGVSPNDLQIESLFERVTQYGVKEVILALSPTIEGDTTMFYLSKKLKSYPVRTSTLARGISFGGELEYTDEITLGRSIVARLPYETGADTYE
jgi:recombination protein RecR